MNRPKLFGLFSLVVIGALILLVPLPLPVSAAGEKVVRVEASQFAYTPGEIKVNTGDWVTLELVSTDVVHGLYLDGYDISVTTDPGRTERLVFKADRPGSFRFRCNVTCGAMHPFMIGRLTVGRNDGFLRAVGLALLAVGSVAVLPRKTG